MRTAKHLKDLLRAKDSPFARLVHGAERQQRLNALLAEVIDSPIIEHVQVGGSQNGELTLVADNSVWGHRLRYLAPSVLAHLRKADPSLTEISIVVRPTASMAPVPEPPSRRNTLSKISATVLIEAAKMSENKKLAIILRRLSRHAIKE